MIADGFGDVLRQAPTAQQESANVGVADAQQLLLQAALIASQFRERPGQHARVGAGIDLLQSEHAEIAQQPGHQIIVGAGAAQAEGQLLSDDGAGHRFFPERLNRRRKGRVPLHSRQR